MGSSSLVRTGAHLGGHVVRVALACATRGRDRGPEDAARYGARRALLRTLVARIRLRRRLRSQNSCDFPSAVLTRYVSPGREHGAADGLITVHPVEPEPRP
jgi:hypothetical protein